MNWLKRLLLIQDYRGDKASLNESEVIKKFKSMSMEDRTRFFMHLPDDVSVKHFEVVEYALKHDEDLHVKLAALKRLHHFKHYPEVNTILSELKKNERSLEPYLSMALFRMERITQEEYELRVSQKG